MKRLLYILLCTTLLSLTSCVESGKVDNGSNIPDGEKGILTLNIDSRAAEGALPDFTLSIYQKSGASAMLVRKYAAGDDIPEYIWLLEGNYTATIESGRAESASFSNNYYFGTSDFTIKGGERCKVDLVATLQNIPVEVAFDSNIKEGCLEGYAVEIFATDDIASATDDTPQLKYTEDRVGYFILPEGVTTLSWQFNGTYKYADNGEEVIIAKSGKIENVEIKKHYKLSFKFSPDANGSFGDIISVTLDTSIDERNDHIAFSPDPEFKGVGFDATVAVNYAGGERKYVANSPANFTTVRLTVGDKVFDPVAEEIAGVKLQGLNTQQLYLTLSDDFFNSLSGGAKIIEAYLADQDGGEVTTDLPYNLQGVNGYNNANEVLAWAGGTTSLSATVFGSPASVQLKYREGEGEWKSFDAVASGTNTYTAQIEGIEANRTYEYNLVIDDKTVGTSLAFTTRDGNQIPNGDLEDWSSSGKVAVPYHFADEKTSFWCTGNWGAADYVGNITNSNSDIRPGSSGKRSAYLDSTYAIIKFAAGNLYIGSWGGMDGMNAKVYFGQPFSYNAKPKAIRFWAKWKCGTINREATGKGKKGDPDLTKIFCCLCNWTEPHMVHSGKAEATTFSPSDANIKSGDARYNGVLYSAYFDTTESREDWHLVELPFTFYGTDPNEVPNYIVLTFTCSGYGDFFDGSEDSWMFVDDIELVY